MSDSNDTGTGDPGTQAVDDAATSTETASAGTPSEQATPQADAADSQPSNRTPDPQPADAAGKPDPTQAQPDAATANPWESDQNPYRKRFHDTLSHAQRLYQERQGYDRQIQEYQQRIADFESKSKAQAEAAKLNPWNKGHPEHAKFRSLMERADTSRRILANAKTPEQQAAARELMQGVFSPDELQSLEQAEQDRKALIADFSADPRGFITAHVQDAVKAAVAEYDAYQGARSSIQGMIQDPNNAKLIESYAPDMARMMDPGVPAREKAFEFARIKAENEALKAQVGKQVETVAADEARTAARSGTPTRTGQQTGKRGEVTDPVAYLAKQGITPSHPQFARRLIQLNEA